MNHSPHQTADLAALLAAYEATDEAAAADGYDNEDTLTAHYAARDAFTAEISRRRGIAYEPGSLLALVREYGATRYAEAVNGECGGNHDVITAEVEAEQLFEKIADQVATPCTTLPAADPTYEAQGGRREAPDAVLRDRLRPEGA